MRGPVWLTFAVLASGGMMGCGEQPTPTASSAPEVAQPEPPPLEQPRVDKRAERAEEIRRLEQLAELLRREIAAKEEHIELLAMADNATGGRDNAQRLALLQRRHVEADTEFKQTNREIGELEAERAVLQKQLEGENLADPLLKEKITQIDTALAIKKENRAKVKTERDELAKLIAGMMGTDFNIQAMRDGLKPRREQLEKLQAELANLRLQHAEQ